MGLKLEELRKRLLQPGSMVLASNANLKSGRQPSFASPMFVQQLTEEDVRERSALASAVHTVDPSSSQVEPLTEPIVLKNEDQAATAAASFDAVPAATAKFADHAEVTSKAIDRFFEPARQCQERLREITQSCEVINQLARSTLELCQPLRNFAERLRKLSKAFFSMRALRNELSMLAEFFEPIGILNKQIVQLESAVQAQLAEVAVKNLESTKILKSRIAELEQSVNSVSELEAQFLELSRCFGAAPGINHEKIGEEGGSLISQ